MIIINLRGGLGNQLFQYAFARSLSYKLNTELFLDISYFNHYEQRKHVIFGLNSFNINGIIGCYPYVEETSIGLEYEIKQKLTKFVEGDFPKSVGEYGIIKDIENIKLPAFFQGYYQFQIKNRHECLITENYFKDNINLIHDELQYIKDMTYNSQCLIKEIKNYDSIALHIRHGDYEDIPNFGLCSVEYYQNAIDMLTSALDNPKFYIFTEDCNWVEEHLKFDVPFKIVKFDASKTIVGRAYGELLNIMSSCKHFIIANSTFSWWGAFLSKFKSKIIIAPKPWFQNRMILGCDTIDNIKTIDLNNNYKKIYQNSAKEIYSLEIDNFICKNVKIESSDELILSDLNINSKLIMNNFNEPKENNGIIMKISIKSNCFNCLKIFYKTETENYCEKNSRELYYYENDDFSHYIMIPCDEKIMGMFINLYTIENHGNNDFIQINSIKIKELIL